MDFYYMSLSAPCRAVMLTAKHLDVELNCKSIDLMSGEQMKPEFVAINPQHCVPTIVDGDLKLWESRAICAYLASQYGKDDSVYPKDPKTRAMVDRLLFFDMGTLYHRFGEYVYPVIFGGELVANPDKLTKVQEAIGFLNTFLDGHEFAVGNKITVADHTLAATMGTMEEAGIDLAPHPNVVAWLERCKAQLPGYNEVNTPGAKAFGKMFTAKLN